MAEPSEAAYATNVKSICQSFDRDGYVVLTEPPGPQLVASLLDTADGATEPA